MKWQEIPYTNRFWDYMRNTRNTRDEIKEYLELASTLSMQADFPDSGYYYQQKQYRFDRLQVKIDKLPKKKQILIKAKVDAIFKQGEKYYEANYQGADGRMYSAYDMDRAMVYGN